MSGFGQADFSAGMVRSVARHLIPPNGVYDAQNVLLDDDGNMYRRGPVVRYSSANPGTSTVLGAVWEAGFSAGRRIVALGDHDVAAMNPGNLAAWTTLAAGTFAPGGGMAAQIGEVMFFSFMTGASTWAIAAYAGSMKAALYSAGTLSVAAGSTNVVGVGTAWVANVDAGMLLRIGSVVGVVKSVNSNTSITLVDPWPGPAAAGSAYVCWPMYVLGAPAATTSVTVAAVAGRLFVANGRTLSFSKPISSTDGSSRWWDQFATTDFHTFPADIVAVAPLRDRLFVFTKAGIYVVSNVALAIVDAFGNAQHRVEKVSGDVVLRAPGGLASWRDSLVVAAVDGVYVLDSSGGMTPASRSINPMWQALMGAGAQVGQVAVYRDHVFVPVQSGGTWQHLVGRLDRVVSVVGAKTSPWTRFTGGTIAFCGALTLQDPFGTPRLLGGIKNGFLGAVHGAFSEYRDDLDALTDDGALSILSRVESREFLVAGDGSTPGFVQQLVLDYNASGAAVAGSPASASIEVSKGERAVGMTSDVTWTALSTVALSNWPNQAPRAVRVGRSARRMSFAFQTTTFRSFILRGFGADVRDRGRRR